MTHRILSGIGCALILVAGSAAAPAAEWGDLVGKFVYDGEAPAQAPLDTAKDKACCGKFKVLDESLVVDEEGGVANIVVFVRTKLKEDQIHPDYVSNVAEKLVYDNKGCRFEPHIATIWLGKQTLIIHNGDECSHNSNLQPLLDKGINPLLPAGGEAPYNFKREQNIPQPVNCNIHPWMKGYVLPRTNPYAVVSAADGTFKIANLPVGEHEFQAWHENRGYLVTPAWAGGKFKITIKEGENEVVEGGIVKLKPEQLKKK